VEQWIGPAFSVTLRRAFLRERTSTYLRTKNHLSNGGTWTQTEFYTYSALLDFGTGPCFSYDWGEDDETPHWRLDRQWQNHPVLRAEEDLDEDEEYLLDELQQEWDLYNGRAPSDACKPPRSVLPTRRNESEVVAGLLDPWRFDHCQMIYGRSVQALAIPQPKQGNERGRPPRTDEEIWKACRALRQDHRVKSIRLCWCVRPPDWRLLDMEALQNHGGHMWFVPDEGFLAVYKRPGAAFEAAREARLCVLLRRIRSWIENGWDPTTFEPEMGFLETLRQAKSRWQW